MNTTKLAISVTACALALVGCTSANTRGYTGDVVAAYGIVQGEDWHYSLKVKRLTYVDGSLVSISDEPDVSEKDAAKFCGGLVSPLASGTNSAAFVTTNLVVYTDIQHGEGSSHLYGTRINLTIRNGIVTDCRSEGVYDLYWGLPEADALRKREEGRAEVERRIGDLRKRRNMRTPRTPGTNTANRVTH